MMYRTLKSIKFLITAPLLVLILYVINVMTSPGNPWWHWAALGLGIAWVIALFRVLRAILVLGGVAGLAAYLNRRQ
jgi:uncharacterized membrane protein